MKMHGTYFIKYLEYLSRIFCKKWSGGTIVVRRRGKWDRISWKKCYKYCHIKGIRLQLKTTHNKHNKRIE